jgi:hypothetical protein
MNDLDEATGLANKLRRAIQNVWRGMWAMERQTDAAAKDRARVRTIDRSVDERTLREASDSVKQRISTFTQQLSERLGSAIADQPRKK